MQGFKFIVGAERAIQQPTEMVLYTCMHALLQQAVSAIAALAEGQDSNNQVRAITACIVVACWSRLGHLGPLHAAGHHERTPVASSLHKQSDDNMRPSNTVHHSKFLEQINTYTRILRKISHSYSGVEYVFHVCIRIPCIHGA